MDFLVALTIIAVVFIVAEFVIRVVKIGTRYSENCERIKNGYPTLDGSRPIEASEPSQHEYMERIQ